MNNFIIITGCYSGGSLLRGLLNEHKKVKVEYEKSCRIGNEISLGCWKKSAEINNAVGITYGNKVCTEYFWVKDYWHGKWKDKYIEKIIEDFYIIFNHRRWSKLWDSKQRRSPVKFDRCSARRHYDMTENLSRIYRDIAPEKIIDVHFEDILLRPKSELLRICSFLDIDFEDNMLLGYNKTGAKAYDDFNTGFNIDNL